MPPEEIKPPSPILDNTPPSEKIHESVNAPPPPAATLIVEGEVTDEQALALQRREQAIEEREARLRGEETTLSERERKIQEREAALKNPAPEKPAKIKRKRNFTDPVICEPEIETD
jgi:hypothetical protein